MAGESGGRIDGADLVGSTWAPRGAHFSALRCARFAKIASTCSTIQSDLERRFGPALPGRTECPCRGGNSGSAEFQSPGGRDHTWSASCRSRAQLRAPGRSMLEIGGGRWTATAGGVRGESRREQAQPRRLEHQERRRYRSSCRRYSAAHPRKDLPRRAAATPRRMTCHDSRVQASRGRRASSPIWGASCARLDGMT